MNKTSFEIQGNIVDVVAKRIFQGTVVIENGKIALIREEPVNASGYLLPGLVDAHIHIESSMLIPSEFARLAVIHGTVGTVSDPHEIANVLGISGVRFMIENGKKVPFKFNFGAPSCVPATPFETSGATLGLDETRELLQMPEIRYLSEMMNFPGVLAEDAEVMGKLRLAQQAGKPVDGHAPGVTGKDAERYIKAGISTDHECYTLEEALEKIKYGMYILIREGSAAKNFSTLYPLINSFPDQVMLCSDDKHPNDLAAGHINSVVKRAISLGMEPMNVLRACTFNPVKHYNLDIGLLQPGDPADLIRVNDLNAFSILETYVDGFLVASDGKTLVESFHETPHNNFNIDPIKISELRVIPEGGRMRILTALEGQLITRTAFATPRVFENNVISEPINDVLKIVVKNRYHEAPAAVGFITGFGLKRGALASSVAHDSHNIVAVGADDESIAAAINLIVAKKGGIALADGAANRVLPLPFAGIMSGEDGFSVARQYEELDRRAKEMGTTLAAPFMTLSFMALLVIPELKLSDKGLFDGNQFQFTGLFTG